MPALYAPPWHIDRSNTDRCPVTHDELGPIGHLERIPNTTAAGRRRDGWRGVTPDGREGPAFDTQRDAVYDLIHQARGPVDPPPPPPDPVIDLIEHYRREGRADQAEAAVLGCIARDIQQMRDNRARHSPPQVWDHLAQYARWIAVATGRPDLALADDETAMHPRVVDILQAATRRQTS